MSRAFPAGPDRLRPMPATQAGRLDEIEQSLRVLARERERFERLGFEQPQARCHQEIRYWSFLAALHSLPSEPKGQPEGEPGTGSF